MSNKKIIDKYELNNEGITYNDGEKNVKKIIEITNIYNYKIKQEYWYSNSKVFFVSNTFHHFLIKIIHKTGSETFRCSGNNFESFKGTFLNAINTNVSKNSIVDNQEKISSIIISSRKGIALNAELFLNIRMNDKLKTVFFDDEYQIDKILYRVINDNDINVSTEIMDVSVIPKIWSLIFILSVFLPNLFFPKTFQTPLFANICFTMFFIFFLVFTILGVTNRVNEIEKFELILTRKTNYKKIKQKNVALFFVVSGVFYLLMILLVNLIIN